MTMPSSLLHDNNTDIANTTTNPHRHRVVLLFAVLLFALTLLISSFENVKNSLRSNGSGTIKLTNQANDIISRAIRTSIDQQQPGEGSEIIDHITFDKIHRIGVSRQRIHELIHETYNAKHHPNSGDISANNNADSAPFDQSGIEPNSAWHMSERTHEIISRAVLGALRSSNGNTIPSKDRKAALQEGITEKELIEYVEAAKGGVITQEN